MIELSAKISAVFLILALLASLFRILKGPGLPDKVIALDLVGMLSMGFIVVYIFLSDQLVFVDIILIFSLLLFFGTVVIAWYLTKKQKHD